MVTCTVLLMNIPRTKNYQYENWKCCTLKITVGSGWVSWCLKHLTNRKKHCTLLWSPTTFMGLLRARWKTIIDLDQMDSFSMVKNTPNPSDPSKLDENDGMQQTSNSLGKSWPCVAVYDLTSVRPPLIETYVTLAQLLTPSTMITCFAFCLVNILIWKLTCIFNLQIWGMTTWNPDTKLDGNKAAWWARCALFGRDVQVALQHTWSDPLPFKTSLKSIPVLFMLYCR